jgi:hypothetical protein
MDVRPVVSPSPYGSVYYAVRTACCIAPGTDITLCVYVQHVSPFLVIDWRLSNMRIRAACFVLDMISSDEI